MSSEEDKMKAFKEQLLSVWDDEKVQEKLKQMLAVIKEKEVMCLKEDKKEQHTLDRNKAFAKCKELEKELAQSRTEWQRERDIYQKHYWVWQSELANIKGAYEQQLQRLRQELEKKQEDLNEWKTIATPFVEVLHMYQLLLDLSPVIKSQVQDHFRWQTPESFLICVGQEKNLLQLWDLVKELNTDCLGDDRFILLKLLSYSVKKVNGSYGRLRYVLRQEQVGMQFDEHFHIRYRYESCPYSGTIKEVILPGIDLIHAGKVELKRKSVVELV